VDERERLTKDKVQWELYQRRRTELLFGLIPLLIIAICITVFTVLFLRSHAAIGWKVAATALFWSLWLASAWINVLSPARRLYKIKRGRFRLEKATVSHVEENLSATRALRYDRERRKAHYLLRRPPRDYLVHFSLYSRPIGVSRERAESLKEGEECYIAVEDGSDTIHTFYRAASYRLEE